MSLRLNSQPKPVEVTLDPVDNQRLARLCGALDENLRQIESALDVTIARRGASFSVRGEQAAARGTKPSSTSTTAPTRRPQRWRTCSSA